MKGLRLSSLTGTLKKVAEKYNRKPVGAIRNTKQKLGPLGENLLLRLPEEYASFSKGYYRLRKEALAGFSFDELCKIKYSSVFAMHETVTKIFETKARYEVVRKIMSSMWRWGCGSGTWNEIVDAYENIRNFSFTDDPNFEVRLDYSTYHNEFGYAKYSRIFIDGVFAFLVYYKKKHVMTIGFSVMEGRQLLLQQVQSAKAVGNRYLYQLPHNRMEFVISLFRKNFSGYKVHVIDAKCLVRKTLSDYRRALEFTEDRCKRYRVDIENPTYAALDNLESRLQEAEVDFKKLSEMISHLKADENRLDSFYRDTGRFTLGTTKRVVNGLVHYSVND